VTEAGANEQFKLLGSPGQVSATGLLNGPPCGATFTIEVPALPDVTVIVVGLTSRVKLWVFPLPQFRLACTAEDM